MTVAIDYDIRQIVAITGGELQASGYKAEIEYLSVDSRKINNPAATLFWAIKTGQRDGSDFIMDLYKKGVRNFVTQTPGYCRSLKGANVIIVKNALEALQKLAAHHRRSFKKITVIGITGSNGKTIVKDWLYSLLSPFYAVVKSPRSYNSQIGVPLSILQIRSHHRYGIFEAGISRPGEMQKLERMIRPQIGIFTNIGSAHDEGFKDFREKIEEKLLLFKRAETVILPGHQIGILSVLRQQKKWSAKVCTWNQKDADYLIRTVKKTPDGVSVVIQSKKRKDTIHLVSDDGTFIQNALNCYVAIDVLGVMDKQIATGFRRLTPLSMRLELQQGINGSSIINDSYSNDLQSLAVALEILMRQQAAKYTIILSDVLQSGLSSEQLYGVIASLIKGKGVRQIIGIGEEISKSKAFFKSIKEQHFFKNTEAFLSSMDWLKFGNEVILVKGARQFRFERIVKRLERQTHETVFSINLSSLAENIRVYKSLIKRGTKVMAMVKAFAYGAGSSEISSLLQFIRADYLAVAYADEGVALREAGIRLPIMVMNTGEHAFDILVKYRLEPEIFSRSLLHSFSNYLASRKIRSYPVHLKIDTGMHRLGFDIGQTEELIALITRNSHIRIQSVFSHLSSADNPDHDAFTMQQFETFRKVVRKIKAVIRYPFLTHISNTSATSRFRQLNLDMVRIGIGMYGVDSNPAVKKLLKPVCRLTTTVSQIKHIKKGEVVGYGMRKVNKAMTIATVGIGYADGYRRQLGNGNGKMFINGKLVPTVGNICMDMTMLDVSGVKDIEEGDEVEVFGENLLIEQLAGWCDTIPYEILTGISGRVKRVYYEE
ncbi:MAG: bifunctional UDP-N-acetylmuramoyl-tripeptide:D-alanyl-D-alanine ligase/alanine racemase [Chitinophagaceae bacterium]|nr:bifunctional UDP-N-acetylmuramoyl-tripeptide:D-alanyl-D-alanine ligase/alanine racemase [Chitinophagaceae bacterium]